MEAWGLAGGAGMGAVWAVTEGGMGLRVGAPCMALRRRVSVTFDCNWTGRKRPFRVGIKWGKRVPKPAHSQTSKRRWGNEIGRGVEQETENSQDEMCLCQSIVGKQLQIN